MNTERDERQLLAEERTDWALERTVLAQERTFSAWLRTGVTAIAAGLGIARLLADLKPSWLVQGIGSVCIVLGALTVVASVFSYRRSQRLLHKAHAHGLSAWTVGGNSLLLLLAAVLAELLILLNGY